MSKREDAPLIGAGWYAHPNIGLLRVFETKGEYKFCAIRKDGNGRFMSMKPTLLSSDITKDFKVVPLPPGVLNVQDKDHLPAEVKKLYHKVDSLFEEQSHEEETTP